MLHKIDLLDYWKEAGYSKTKKIEHRKEIDKRLFQFKEYIQQQINKADFDDNYKNTILNKINFECTTIFNDSLYSAWGKIISNIVPNLREYERKIQRFSKEIKADECVLFEKNTFLPIASCRTEFIAKERQIEVNEIMTNKLKQMNTNNYDPHRNHKKMNFTLKTAKYQLYFRQFTTNTFILLVFYMTTARKSDQLHKVNYLCMNTEFDQVASSSKQDMGSDLTTLAENHNLSDTQTNLLAEFKSKLNRYDPEQNNVGFDQQSLIEACLEEFREDMRRLDAGEKKAYYNYTPRER